MPRVFRRRLYDTLAWRIACSPGHPRCSCSRPWSLLCVVKSTWPLPPHCPPCGSAFDGCCWCSANHVHSFTRDSRRSSVAALRLQDRLRMRCISACRAVGYPFNGILCAAPATKQAALQRPDASTAYRACVQKGGSKSSQQRQRDAGAERSERDGEARIRSNRQTWVAAAGGLAGRQAGGQARRMLSFVGGRAGAHSRRPSSRHAGGLPHTSKQRAPLCRVLPGAVAFFAGQRVVPALHEIQQQRLHDGLSNCGGQRDRCEISSSSSCSSSSCSSSTSSSTNSSSSTSTSSSSDCTMASAAAGAKARSAK